MATAKAFFNALDNLHALDFSDPKQKALYVENMQGDNNAAEKLLREISFRSGQGVYLFTGQVGSGKSTELQRLKACLEKDGCTVFYTDLKEWLDLNDPVELGSFLLAVVASWIGQAGSLLGTRTPAQRLTEFLSKTNLRLDSLTVGFDFAAVKTNLQFALSQDRSIVKQVEDTLRANKTKFIAQVHDFVESLVAEFPSDRKIVLLIDSLEKFGDITAIDGSKQDSVLALFQNAHALKLPLVHVVYSISYLLYEQNRQLSAQLGGAIAVNLPSVHVFKRHSNEPDPTGLDRLRELLTKRYAAWGEFFTLEQVNDIALKTGGDLRDFMRVFQVAVLSNNNTRNLSASDEHLAQGYDQVRPSLAIDGQHIAWMTRLQSSHRAELEGNIDFHVLTRYLQTKHVLAYLNGQTWYALHPLIQEEVLAIEALAKDRLQSSASANI